jgi:hypothetical protein
VCVMVMLLVVFGGTCACCTLTSLPPLLCHPAPPLVPPCLQPLAQKSSEVGLRPADVPLMGSPLVLVLCGMCRCLVLCVNVLCLCILRQQ